MKTTCRLFFEGYIHIPGRGCASKTVCLTVCPITTTSNLHSNNIYSVILGQRRLGKPSPSMIRARRIDPDSRTEVRLVRFLCPPHIPLLPLMSPPNSFREGGGRAPDQFLQTKASMTAADSPNESKGTTQWPA